MSATFIFEELDGATRDYLAAVRDSQGAGSPGVFAATSDSLPGYGCILGPLVIAATLLFTLTTWIGIVYNDPLAVACLQTAGLLVGGWLLATKFRGQGGRNAGTWVYADPLHLYEAFREQVTVTQIDEVADAHYTHHYDSNGNYQKSDVNIALGRAGRAALTLASEARAEQLVTYLNYLAWARGPDGGDRGDLEPADLGGLARYVVRNGDEPKDAENNINLSMIELDVTAVPEEPAREGRALPAFLPYVFMFAAAVLCFLIMGFAINPVVRDDAVYDLVMTETSPPSIEPRFLRAYLTDRRNRLHRDQVLTKLATFYAPAISHVQTRATDKQLGKGMADILTGLGKADQPVVSLRITETKSPPGSAEAKGAREAKLRTEFADGVANAFAAEDWGKPIVLANGLVAKDPLPPIGHQLIAFVEPPDDDKPVHFDIAYALEPTGTGQYQIVVNVTLRGSIEDKDGISRQFTMPNAVAPAELNDGAMMKLKDELIVRLVGTLAPAALGVPGGPFGPGIQPLFP